MNETSLEALEKIDIRIVPKESLVDIKDVTINPELERGERVADFVRQVKNPYCFICDGVIVKVRFARDGDTLEDKIKDYFLEH